MGKTDKRRGGNWGLWRACNLTAFINSLTRPVGQPFASCHEGPGSIPRGILKWNQDSPVSVVSLHWWPWSLWPHLRRASSRTINRPSCWQYDNPTWSHTALLSQFHARCRFSFRLHSRHSRLLGGGTLWRAWNLTALIHSLTGPVGQPFASRHVGPGFNLQGATYVKIGFSC